MNRKLWQTRRLAAAAAAAAATRMRITMTEDPGREETIFRKVALPPSLPPSLPGSEVGGRARSASCGVREKKLTRRKTANLDRR